MCAYCSKAKTTLDKWIKIQDFIEIKRWMNVTHGICPSCYKIESKKIDDLASSD